MAVDVEELRARIEAMSARAKTAPKPALVVEPERRPYRASSRPPSSTYGGPPGPKPSEGGCGHVGAMSREEGRCSCERCGAAWKVGPYQGRVQWVVTRTAS